MAGLVAFCILLGSCVVIFWATTKETKIHPLPFFLSDLLKGNGRKKLRHDGSHWAYEEDAFRLEISRRGDEWQWVIFTKPNERQPFTEKAALLTVGKEERLTMTPFFDINYPALASFLRIHETSLIDWTKKWADEHTASEAALEPFPLSLSSPFQANLQQLLSVRAALLQNSSLSFENRHFLNHTMPNDLLSLFRSFERLPASMQATQTKELLLLLDTYSEQLGRMNQTETDLLRDLEKQMKIVQKRWEN